MKTAFGIRGFSKNEINQVVLKTEMTLKSNRLAMDASEEPMGAISSRTASLEGLPTSASQCDVQMMSHTLTIREVNIFIILWFIMTCSFSSNILGVFLFIFLNINIFGITKNVKMLNLVNN